MAHYFSNPVPLGRDAVNGYRSLPRHVQDNRAANFVAAPRYEKVPIFDRGSECQATWQGAKFGKANPRVSHKIGKDTSLTALQRAAEKARTLAACRRTYLDIRVVGKMRGKPDSSHPWAAYRAAQLGVYGAFDWPDWCSHYARAYGHLLAMVPDAPDYPDWINDSACIRLGRFKPRKTTVLPRTFMLFKEDKRNFWRRGCNEWMPANLLGEWREDTRARIRASNARPDPEKPQTYSVWSSHLSLDAPMRPLEDLDGDTWVSAVIDEGTYPEPKAPLLKLDLDCLGIRERAILEAFYGEGSPTKKQLGQEFGLSGRRVGQIISEALAKVRSAAS